MFVCIYMCSVFILGQPIFFLLIYSLFICWNSFFAEYTFVLTRVYSLPSLSISPFSYGPAYGLIFFVNSSTYRLPYLISFALFPVHLDRSCLFTFACYYSYLFLYRDPKHSEWAHTFIAALIQLQQYCKEFHPIGVSWGAD